MDICFQVGNGLLEDRAQDSPLVSIFAPPTIPGIISHARIGSSGPTLSHASLIPLTLTLTYALSPDLHYDHLANILATYDIAGHLRYRRSRSVTTMS